MKLRSIAWVVAGTLALHAPARPADASQLALQEITLEPTALTAITATPAADVTPIVTGFTMAGESHGSTLESVHWYPRRWRDRGERNYGSSSSGPSGSSQIHAGFFDPDGETTNSFLAGARGGFGADEHLQFGLGLDWVHKSERNTALISTVDLPGGGTSERRLELARSSSNLFPIMGYAQFTPGNRSQLTPYFGVGGGYEALFLSAENFQTGDKFDATYGGWGWQAWAGLSVPIGGTTRLSTEVFRNQSSVDRNVSDNSGNYREVVTLDGLGMRFGFNWGF